MKYHIAAAISMLFVSAGCFPNKKPMAGGIPPLDAKVMGPLAPMGKPGQIDARSGDEIVVCGRLYHTGTPVVTWMDPGGYDAYRTERRFSPWPEASYGATTRAATTNPKDNGIDGPARYNTRFAPTARAADKKFPSTAATQPTTLPDRTPTPLTDAELDMVRGGGWTLPLLRDKIDQFVLHYDVCGTSHTCFRVLQDDRGLSVTFMCDVDGTIYQTLDVKERAWQATKANSRSIGIEIANMGVFSPEKPDALNAWYRKGADGRTRLVLPPTVKQSWIRTPGFVGYPSRNEPVVGEIQHKQYAMYDLTPQQYVALEHLTATLCTIFPKITCDYPRDGQGKLIPHTLTNAEYNHYEGVMGHYHVQTDKQDPGPALQWDRLIDGAKALMKK